VTAILTASHARHRRVSLSTTGDPDVLLRVLSLLRRRNFDVLRVEYQAGDHHRPTVLDLSVASTGRTAHQLDAWMSNVVGVLSVDDIA
jgi:acetolactate synthase regulatory subunit